MFNTSEFYPSTSIILFTSVFKRRKVVHHKGPTFMVSIRWMTAVLLILKCIYALPKLITGILVFTCFLLYNKYILYIWIKYYISYTYFNFNTVNKLFYFTTPKI